ncbi:carboxylesterase [Bordetella sp. 15P40C-2]|uniref:alpha/beta hydrolase n=1 Tax=Bordetella sp. 15P40C-2 TaxID=2572246 RepID=UPI001325A82D|nr:alpha/beta fold hydrolase [Bordetella sp. 15P40C-2]MVW72537.1 alpha/beta fold hydrolase [Bordetella sp. 15P40C-2]
MTDAKTDETPSPATGVLLIHGLGGTQYDLGALLKALQRAGTHVQAPTLPGHGTRPEDLLHVSAEDWLTAVHHKYQEMLQTHETVHIVGMCMGSLLAVELAKRVRHQRGKLAVLAAPIYIDGWSTPWYRGVRHALSRLDYFCRRIKIMEEEPFGIKNNLLRAIVKKKLDAGESFHYGWVPLAAVRQVDRLRAWVTRNLDHIQCPTLVVHAREDELTSLKSAQFLMSQLTHAPKQLEVLENSYHMICVDNDRNQVVKSVLDHLGLASARPSASPPEKN